MSRDEYRRFVQDAERMVQMNADHAHDFELWEAEFWAQYRDEEI